MASPISTAAGVFQFFDTPQTYTLAEAACVQWGGHLASIRSVEENNLVLRLCAGAECWIGFNDVNAEGTWKWTDGWPSNFTSFPGQKPPWNPGEEEPRAAVPTSVPVPPTRAPARHAPRR